MKKKSLNNSKKGYGKNIAQTEYEDDNSFSLSSETQQLDWTLLDFEELKIHLGRRIDIKCVSHWADLWYNSAERTGLWRAENISITFEKKHTGQLNIGAVLCVFSDLRWKT